MILEGKRKEFRGFLQQLRTRASGQTLAIILG